MAEAGVTSLKSILDKPLSQLTEEDISQLTREDCRKYLKEKGMRRPSWNKSQAIQQVISLKALLETTEDSGASALRKILVSKPPETPNSADSVKETSGDANNAVSPSADDTFPYRSNDSPKSCPPGPIGFQQEDTGTEAVASRSSGAAANRQVGQMTIFYCGKVNVYDGVPPDKARSIMHLAATSMQSPPDDPVNENTVISVPCQLQSPCYRQVPVPSSATVFQSKQTGKMTDPQQFMERGNAAHDLDIEGQANRKVSLQRYLEKRKDRGRFKGRKTMAASSNLESYFNHHVATHASNVQLTTNNASSQSLSGMLQASCSPADNQAKITNFLVDLNEDVHER